MVLVDGYGGKWEWLLKEAYRKLLEELARIDVKVNTEKTRLVDLTKGETFSFLGFDFRRRQDQKRQMGCAHDTEDEGEDEASCETSRTSSGASYRSPSTGSLHLINPKLRGWMNYFRIGNSSGCFSYIKDWVEKKVQAASHEGAEPAGLWLEQVE